MTHALVMTDSTCDIPAEIVRRFDIRVVPTYVQFGTESLADDGVELTRSGFYERLPVSSQLPTTAAPPLGQTLEVMARALADADHVIGITAPASLSGIYNTFRLAAEQTVPDRVTLVDGQMVSMGLGWQVIIACEMIQAGHSPGDIAVTLQQTQHRIDVWAALDTFEYLRRSGRIGWATAVVGDVLDIKPIIRMHMGVVDSIKRVRTGQRAFQTLLDLAHEAAPLERLAVMHTHYPAGAEQLTEALADIHPPGELIIVEATPVLGVHLGPKGLGLGVVRNS